MVFYQWSSTMYKNIDYSIKYTEINEKVHESHTRTGTYTVTGTHRGSQRNRDRKRGTQYAYPHQIQRQSTNDCSHPVFNFEETEIDKFLIKIMQQQPAKNKTMNVKECREDYMEGIKKRKRTGEM